MVMPALLAILRSTALSLFPVAAHKSAAVNVEKQRHRFFRLRLVDVQDIAIIRSVENVLMIGLTLRSIRSMRRRTRPIGLCTADGGVRRAAPRSNWGNNGHFGTPNDAFLMGKFSLLDALADQPLDEALRSVDLGGEIAEALLGIGRDEDFLTRIYQLIGMMIGFRCEPSSGVNREYRYLFHLEAAVPERRLPMVSFP